jgi:curli biogenesis system outer membrane secretion channel CsgG
MKFSFPLLLAVAAILIPAVSHAQTGKKETLAVGSVQTNASLVTDMERKGKIIELGRVVGSVDHHLIAALVQTRKFSILGRSDLKDIIKEQDLGASGLVDTSTAPEQGMLKGAKYRLVTTVDHFLEGNETANFNGRVATKRRIQISAQAIVYDTTTGEALDSVDIPVEKFDVVYEDNIATDAKRTDDLMPATAKELSLKIANRVVDVVFPAKIIDVDNSQVTVNRGDGFGIQVGDIWNVFGPTKVIKDPDSGEVIKRKGTLVGKIKFTSIDPTYSQAQIIEDKGVVAGSVVSQP